MWLSDERLYAAAQPFSHTCTHQQDVSCWSWAVRWPGRWVFCFWNFRNVKFANTSSLKHIHSANLKWEALANMRKYASAEGKVYQLSEMLACLLGHRVWHGWLSVNDSLTGTSVTITAQETLLLHVSLHIDRAVLPFSMRSYNAECGCRSEYGHRLSPTRCLISHWLVPFSMRSCNATCTYRSGYCLSLWRDNSCPART